ncbi:MAG: hypothetical protein ACI4II_07840 [Acutalibacteraceae bacterium]
MKRVKSACILQTLVFAQKDEFAYTRNRAAAINREEFEKYKSALDKAKTRYQILDENEQPDGSLVVHVRKQYNDKTDVSEYFS